MQQNRKGPDPLAHQMLTVWHKYRAMKQYDTQEIIHLLCILWLFVGISFFLLAKTTWQQLLPRLSSKDQYGVGNRMQDHYPQDDP